MAVPFRRKSSTRIKKGRSTKSWNFHQKAFHQPLIECSNCQKTKILHRACSHCSIYRAKLQG
ncbi:MAG: 50S ribosomal protein L32 [Spiroplasmataceae bacterium]|nr:50S ribosomal protein L32 [Spiroplasmataceae bacterium]